MPRDTIAEVRIATVTLLNGITVPTFSDLAVRLLRTFFILTAPTN